MQAVRKGQAIRRRCFEPHPPRRHRDDSCAYCFGYAAILNKRPPGYSFLPELERANVQQISIETAQSHLDCSILAALPSKTILLTSSIFRT